MNEKSFVKTPVTKTFDYLIIGIDVAGIGAACSLRSENVLLVDRRIVCGHDFTSAYKANTLDDMLSLSLESSYLLDQMHNKNLVLENKISVPAVSGILAGMLIESKCHAMFLTEVTGISFLNGEYEVTLFSSNGFETIRVGNILDVTAQGVAHDSAKGLRIEQYYNAMLTRVSGGNEPYHTDLDGAVLQSCRFPSEFIFGIEVSENEEYYDARQRLHRLWQTYHKNRLSDFELTATASEFMYVFPEADQNGYTVNISKNWMWHPSASYNDLLSAFEGGVRLCRQK